ncbi:MAG: 50S ribosomal protein L32e [Candidatus Bathyarchaeota archaeon]
MAAAELNIGEEKKKESSTSELEREYVTLLRTRVRQKSKKPHFTRQESWRYKRVATSWRRPRGIDSKMRLKLKGRPKLVVVGYRSPRLVRGFHPSGFVEILVYNVKDLEKVDSKQVVRIGHTVGLAKKIKIVEKAKELGLRVLNARGVDVGEPEEPKKTSV